MGGRIPDSEVEAVRSASDLVTIASERMSLKRAGRSFKGLCPFHDEKTPSFSVNPEAGRYYCFGCGAGGDVFEFVRELDGLTFVEAVEALARRAGITLTFADESPDERRRREERPRLASLMNDAVEWFHSQLRSGPEAAPARKLLAARGYGKDVASRFSLGYAPGGWDATTKAMKAKGYLGRELADAGLTMTSSRGEPVGLFRNRVVFPIFDSQGQAVAFAGRRLVEGDGPKYINSPETILYRKSRLLYGLNWARPMIVAEDTALVVEGYTDVIGFHLAGATNAVATCGTALGEEHLRLLKRYAGSVVLAFDGDAAGAAATERTFGIAAEIGLDVRVAILPEGKDPADVAADGAEAVRALLESPRPLLEFKVDREMDRARLDSSEGEARAVQVAAAAIAQHPDPLVRHAAVRRTVRRMRDVTEDQLARAVDAARRGTAQPVPLRAGAPGPSSQDRRLPRVEEQALASLVQMPGAFLGACPGFSPDWFENAAARAIATEVVRGVPTLDSGRAFDITCLDVGEPAASLARRVAVLDPPGVEDRVIHAKETAAALERRWVDRRVRDLQVRLESAESSGAWEDVKALDVELVAFIDRRQALGDV
ncbi:MAG: DNA primase [Actinobacteria bacterium ATB1]|nr:DNA primase [Actinobacteria bacterium ATB1]